jgi:predicted acylesterase/phospholipase RssA
VAAVPLRWSLVPEGRSATHQSHHPIRVIGANSFACRDLHRSVFRPVETHSLRVLAEVADREERLQAMRANASLPRLGGELPSFRGERMADGGLIEPIPYRTALRDAATHVVVRRSRPAAYRRPALSALGESLALRDDRGLVELMRARSEIYNRQAAVLATTRPSTVAEPTCRKSPSRTTRV